MFIASLEWSSRWGSADAEINEHSKKQKQQQQN